MRIDSDYTERDMAHKTQDEMRRDITDAESLVAVGGYYTHYKDNSKEYVVTGLAILEATQEVSVIYEAQYGRNIPFIRPLSDFLASVEVNGVSVPRFSRAR